MANTVRIISRKYKNRRLAVPSSAHPMGERERNAIFNSLGDKIEGACVLDMFAGSGALGIEALSRGAAKIVFVDKDRQARGVIKSNLRALSATAEVLPSAPQEEYDVIFADPPYDNPQYELVQELASHLASSGILILSQPKSDAPLEFPNLRLASTKTYAGARISTYTTI